MLKKGCTMRKILISRLTLLGVILLDAGCPVSSKMTDKIEETFSRIFSKRVAKAPGQINNKFYKISETKYYWGRIKLNSDQADDLLKIINQR